MFLKAILILLIPLAPYLGHSQARVVDHFTMEETVKHDRSVNRLALAIPAGAIR